MIIKDGAPAHPGRAMMEEGEGLAGPVYGHLVAPIGTSGTHGVHSPPDGQEDPTITGQHPYEASGPNTTMSWGPTSERGVPHEPFRSAGPKASEHP